MKRRLGRRFLIYGICFLSSLSLADVELYIEESFANGTFILNAYAEHRFGKASNSYIIFSGKWRKITFWKISTSVCLRTPTRYSYCSLVLYFITPYSCSSMPCVNRTLCSLFSLNLLFLPWTCTASSSNTFTKTFGGIDGAGKRLAEEVSFYFLVKVFLSWTSV